MMFSRVLVASEIPHASYRSYGTSTIPAWVHGYICSQPTKSGHLGHVAQGLWRYPAYYADSYVRDGRSKSVEDPWLWGDAGILAVWKSVDG